ncbi:hypothetical protein MFUM_370005 [Methylacidiphilum fumariolicum SolV]|uniref:Uncharacterized protein n=2 Tax=Candidatus Methylacidiphilum fumarolicum TaxID=591154 RepID=I0JY24_METFB|nr:conserved protein of unknown function [Candidatus Methylacidiphilum fumarolicum]CCG92143.1 hypothetical protein MFUM_370005 [Methylacidiphilum fumariolicum SolV]
MSILKNDLLKLCVMEEEGLGLYEFAALFSLAPCTHEAAFFISPRLCLRMCFG